jgi:cytochrome c oxidase subunit 1
LEWHCDSPPPHYNFEHAPVVNDPYNYVPLVYVSPEKGWEYRHEDAHVLPRPSHP